MHDVPYIQSKNFGPEIVATLSAVASEMRKLVPKNLPLGIQVCVLDINFITLNKYRLLQPNGTS